MKLYFHHPPPPLSAYVKSMLLYEGYTGAGSYEVLLPDGVPQLVITLDDQPRFARTDPNAQDGFRHLKKSWVNGLLTRPLVYRPEQNASTLTIQFTPQGLGRFLRQPAHELVDNIYEVDVMGQKTVLILRDMLLAQDSAARKISTAESFLYNAFAKSQGKALIVDHVVNNPCFATTPIKAISGQLGCSTKHLIGQFHRAIGVTPKKLQTILKVKQAIALLNAYPGMAMAQVALNCGFYDQSHFIKNFKQIVGITPQAYLKADRLYPHVLTK